MANDDSIKNEDITKKKPKKKKKPVLQKRPLSFIYYPARFFIKPYIKFRYNLVYSGDKVHGPALVLSNHTSNDDYKFLGSAISERISFLATYHWFTFKKFAFWLKLVGAIPKYQFATDLEAMRKIKYVVTEKKGVVFIAPEGTIYASGHLGYMSPAIAKMIRFLKVPVYACKIEGAGLGNAKWSKTKHRGKVSVTTTKLIEAEETTTLKPAEIMDRITSALTYNEFEFQRREKFLIKGSDKAEGFETMFYRCPCCQSEFRIRTTGNDVICDACGTKATIQDDFSFKWNGDKQYFLDYSQWYDWQYELMKKEVADPAFELCDVVDYGIDEPGVDNYVKVGKGTLTFNHSGWTYKGTFKGEEIEEHDELRDVFLATLKVGVHFELPVRNGHNRVFYPTDGITSMKWHLASRAMSELLGY